jgi:hypothetical protein
MSSEEEPDLLISEIELTWRIWKVRTLCGKKSLSLPDYTGSIFFRLSICFQNLEKTCRLT